MRNIRAVRLAAVAGTALLAVLASGCATASPPAARASVQACSEFGVQAIEHHVKVTRVPPACAGLSRAARDQAVGRAVYIVAGAGHAKAAWRQRAASVSGYLGDLVVAVAPPAVAAPRAAGSVIPARQSSGTSGVLAALLAWLLTAGSGAAIVARWLRRGRRRQDALPAAGPRRGRRVLSPLVSGHLGLAVAGLAVWSAYLATGWRPLAWLSAALLLPVAGLGMAVLVAGLDRLSAPAPATSAPATSAPATAAPATAAPATAAPATAAPAMAAAARATAALGAAVPAAAAPAGPGPAPGRAPQPSRQVSATFVAAAHGLFAMATLALVMLALTGAR